jgi:hypothetical protein
MFAVVGAEGLLGALLTVPLRRLVRARAALVGEAWLLACVVPCLLVAHAALLIGPIVAVCEFPTPLSNSLVSGHAWRLRLTTSGAACKPPARW